MNSLSQILVCCVVTVGLTGGCNRLAKTESKTEPNESAKTSPSPGANGGQPKQKGRNKPAPTGIQGTWVITPARRSSSGNIIEDHFVYSGNTFTATIGIKGAPRRKTMSQGTFRIDKAKGVIHISARNFSGRNNTPGPVVKSTRPFQIMGNTMTLGKGREMITLERVR